jgi:hypothetical protein
MLDAEIHANLIVVGGIGFVIALVKCGSIRVDVREVVSIRTRYVDCVAVLRLEARLVKTGNAARFEVEKALDDPMALGRR